MSKKSEKLEKFILEFEKPEYFRGELKKLGRYFPVMATNLLLGVEVLKLRLSYEKKPYTQQEVYQAVYDNFSTWMHILKRSFPVDERKAKKK